MFNFLRLSAICCLLTLTPMTFVQNTLHAKSRDALSPASIVDLDHYWGLADIVAETRVVAIDAGTRNTRVTLAVDAVFKGSVADEALSVTVQSGKIIVDKDEPVFKSHDHSIVFLESNGRGSFMCIDGSRGKKTIINDNLYFDPKDPFKTVKIKEYRDALLKLSVGKKGN